MEGKWICSNCQTENLTKYRLEDLNEKIYSCCFCGKASSLKFLENEREYLACIAYKGIGSSMTTGPVQNAAGEILWGDPNSGLSTREIFTQKYGWDPWTSWCSLPRNRSSPICKGWEIRCKKEK
jgi:hypothetical protein